MMHPPQWGYLTFIKKMDQYILTLSGALQPIDKQMEQDANTCSHT